MLIIIIILSILVLCSIGTNIYLFIKLHKTNVDIINLQNHIDTRIIPDLQVQLNYMNNKINEHDKYPEHLARRITQCEIETARVMNGLRILNNGFEIPIQSYM